VRPSPRAPAASTPSGRESRSQSRTSRTPSQRAARPARRIAVETWCSPPTARRHSKGRCRKLARDRRQGRSGLEDQEPFKRRYEPSHPDADKDGFVALPNVEFAEEMVDMLSAARAYQANLTAINLVRDMLQRALELGR
jgi:flagellar basal-body rod protein FlgC